jgi:hypothetical protein
MSKKLIAIAAAGALALSGLVATTSASALPVTGGALSGESYLNVTSTVTRAGSGTASDPYTFAVPSAGTVAAASIVTFQVSSSSKRTAATVSSTSGIKLLDAPGDATNKYTSASGSASLSLTTTDSGTLVFYGFPTSTTTGLVTLTIGTDVTQVYIKGVAGPAYNIATVTPPASLEPEGKGTYVVTVTDAFGNAVTAGSLSVTRVGGGSGGSFISWATSGENDKIVYSATAKRWQGIITAGDVAGQIAVGLQIDGLTATDDQKTAFGAPKNTFFSIITTSSSADLVISLRAQVATLTATVAALTADYNKLATRWNTRYDLKKAPKHKVVLK